MYKFVVVTDPDTASGFRLAGVDVIEAPDLDKARSIILTLIYKDDTGIVAINEEFMNSLDEKVMEKIEKTYRPVIIPIPTGLRGTRSSYLEGLLRRAIGYNIVVG